MWKSYKELPQATGIQTVADDFKSDLDHYMSFGDSFNDESMLRYVKHSIVMANGVQAMKDIAYFVKKILKMMVLFML